MPALRSVLVTLSVLLTAASARAVPAEQRMAGLPFVRVPAGRYSPLYRSSPEGSALQVAAFWLMSRPVTNEEFLTFVREHPNYRRDQLARVFAEAGYLAHWAEPVALGTNARPQQPVTHVSWFAARAFCASKGLRLPSEAEWERAASDKRAARSRQTILQWYASPHAELPDVPFGPANDYGVHDLHGVAWEWVEDFNSAAVDADPREQGESAQLQFCGGAALRAEDASDYATFMRVAMRSSLQASYNNAHLTFRCAADLEVKHASP